MDMPDEAQRARDIEALREKILEGGRSPLGQPADDAYFDELRARILGKQKP